MSATGRKVAAVATSLSALFLSALLLSGCANGRQHVSGTAAAVAGQPSATASAAPAADGVQQVVIDAVEGEHFRPDVVYAHLGKLRITITNVSQLPHDLVIPTLSVSSSTIFAGDSATVTIDLTKPGNYPFECTFHQHQGMDGELIVS